MGSEDILNKDLYKILNIEKNATSREIKLAYRHLMRIYHPDVNEDADSKKKFNEIRKAYDILSDSKKKKLYDIKHGYNFEKSNEKNTT
ncbi:DnaJ domain-containing protein [bacterium]|nr:DnaJ domain-containing protein [bacterium]